MPPVIPKLIRLKAKFTPRPTVKTVAIKPIQITLITPKAHAAAIQYPYNLGFLESLITLRD